MMKLWNKTKGLKLPSIALVALIFALTSVFSRQEVPAKEPIESPPISPYESNIAGIGVIEPKNETISVGTELSGIVRQVLVTEGEKVIKDAPLFILDQREINAQIGELKAALESAKIQESDATDLLLTINSIKDNSAVSRDDKNKRKYAADLAKARVAEAKARLFSAITTKERLTIKAPITGTILDINIKPGEFAAAGVLSKPLMRIGDLSTLYVRTEIDEENAFLLDDKAQAIGIKRGSNDPLPLTFVKIEPYVDSKTNLSVSGQRVDTRVLQVLYSIPITTKNLYVGQQMDVFIQTSNSENKKTSN